MKILWTTRRAALGLLVLVVAVAAGCSRKATGAGTGAARVRVLAAASLADVFREIGAAFEAANPGVRVEFSFAGSNQLRGQLENGGPGDVFVSADRKQMDAASASKVVDIFTVRIFAHNELALVVPKKNARAVKQLADLGKPGVRIVIADEAVPVGAYTKKMLDAAEHLEEYGSDFVAKFNANVVSREENVAAVVAKVALDEADAGLAYASDAFGDNRAKLTVIKLSRMFEQQADYYAAVTANASDGKLAGRFLAYLLSGEAGEKLTARGFVAPGPP